MLLQHLVTEACAQLHLTLTSHSHLADALVLLIVRIITRQQEGTIVSCALAFSVISSDGDQVQRVTQILQIVLLQLHVISHRTPHLQPVQRAFRWLIGRIVHQRLHHQPFTAIRHRLHQKLLHLLCIFQLVVTSSHLSLPCLSQTAYDLPPPE